MRNCTATRTHPHTRPWLGVAHGMWHEYVAYASHPSSSCLSTRHRSGGIDNTHAPGSVPRHPTPYGAAPSPPHLRPFPPIPSIRLCALLLPVPCFSLSAHHTCSSAVGILRDKGGGAAAAFLGSHFVTPASAATSEARAPLHPGTISGVSAYSMSLFFEPGALLSLHLLITSIRQLAQRCTIPERFQGSSS